jgi:periplasmic divalent cation tolerance protein
VTTTVVVLSTAGSREEAERIASALVDERLAACVNVVDGVTSIYRWQGKVERAAEVLLVIKTRRASSSRLMARLGELHSYDVPEAIVLPIAAGSRPYLQWLLAETASTPRGRPQPRGRTSPKRAKVAR